jgi:hypothetical protein
MPRLARAWIKKKENTMSENVLLQPFNPLIAEIEKLKEYNAGLLFDYESKDGNKLARSHIFALRKVKSKVADAHKSAKADALEVCRVLDGYKRDLTASVDGMIEVHDKPLREIEEREARIKAAEEARIREEKEAEEMRIREEMESRQREIEEREAAIRKREEEMQRIEREKQIERETEERVKREVEEERKKQEAENARREANKKHRSKILNEAYQSLVANEVSADQAKQFILLVANGKIANMRIQF